MRWVCALGVLAACGRLGFDPSADAGEDDTLFTKLRLPPGGWAWSVSISPLDPDVAWLVAGTRVFRTTDRAATWTDCARTVTSNAVLADPASATGVYLGDDRGLHHSADGCATWTTIAPVGSIWQLARDGTDILMGGSSTWRLRGGQVEALPTMLTNGEVVGLVGRGNLVFGTSWASGVRRSTNGGASFGDGNAGLTDRHTQHIAFGDPANDSIVLVQTDDGVHRSTNGGASWGPSTGGSEGRGAIAIDPGDPAVVLAGTWNGMIASTDNGVTFDPTDRRSASMDYAAIEQFEFDPSGSGRVLAATTRGVFAATGRNLAWQPVVAGLDAWWIGDLVAVPGTSTLYAATLGGLLRSDDGGDTWDVTRGDGFEGRTALLRTLHVPPAATTEVWSAGGAWLFHSVDRGDTVDQRHAIGANDDWNVRSIASSPGWLWIGTGTRLWSSDDAGDTWSARDFVDRDRDIVAILASDDGDLWLATDDGLMFSDDHAQSYVELPTTSTESEVNALARTADGDLLIGTDDGAHVDDGGWRRAGLDGQRIEDLAVDGERWYAATLAGVFVTDDRGATWAELPGLARVRPLRLVIDQAGRLIVGTDGFGLYRMR